MTLSVSLGTVMVLIGIVIMVYATYRGYLLYKLFASPTAWFSMGGSLTRTWRILLILIIFFLGAYIVYFIMDLMQLPITDEGLLVSLVFLFGAIFVLLVVNLSYATYSRFSPQNNVKKTHRFRLRRRSDAHDDTEEIADAGTKP